MVKLFTDSLINEQSAAPNPPADVPTKGEQFSAAFNLGPGNAVLKSAIYKDVTGAAISPLEALVDHWTNPSNSEVSRTINYFQDPTKFDDLVNDESITAEFIADSKSMDELLVRKRMRDEELKLREVLDNPNFGVLDYASQFAGYMADPTNLIPVGALYGITTKAVKGAIIGAAKLGAATGASVALSEAALVQPTSEVKTAEDSAIEIVAGALLGATLGSVIGGLGGRRLGAISQEITAVLKDKTPEVAQKLEAAGVDVVGDIEYAMRNDGTLSAARATNWKEAGYENLAYLPESIAKTLAGRGIQANPVISGLTASENSIIKAITPELFNTSLKTGFDVLGVARNESLEMALGRAAQKVQTKYVNRATDMVHKVNGYNPESTISKLGSDFGQISGRSKYSASDINSMLQKLMDEEIELVDIPEAIQSDAMTYWKDFSNDFKALWAEAYKFKIVDSALPRTNAEGLVTDIHRNWDNIAITNNMPQFRKLVHEGLIREIDNQIKALVSDSKDLIDEISSTVPSKYSEENKKALSQKVDAMKREIKKLKEKKSNSSKLNQEVKKVIRNIQQGKLLESESENPLTGAFQGTRILSNQVPTKPRRLPLTNKEVGEFIKHDFIQNGLRTMQHLEKQVIFARKLEELDNSGLFINPETGGPSTIVKNVTDLRGLIKQHYDFEINKLRELGDVAGADRLLKVRDKFIQPNGWFDNSLSLLMGNFQQSLGKGADKMVDTYLWYQVLNKLGRVTISSIPDMARVMVSHPAANFMSKGLIAGIGRLLNSSALKQNKAMLEKFGTSIDMTMNTMYKLMMSGDQTNNPTTRFDLAKDFVSRFFLNASGMAPWNNFWRGVSAHMSADATISAGEILAKGGQLKKWQTDRLRVLGFRDEDAINLYREWSSNGANNSFGGVKTIGEGGISNALMDKLAASVQKEIDEVILIPGAGDIPFWAKQTAYGKIINQFQSFNQAATNRYLLPALQDLAALRTPQAENMRIAIRRLGWMMTAIGMGTLSMDIKHRISNKGEGIDWTPESFIAQGLSSSGILGYVLQYPLGLYGSLTNSMDDRYADRNMFSLLGPGASFLGDIGTTGSGLKNAMLYDKPISREKVQKLMPFRNLDVVRIPLDYIYDYLGVLPPKASPQYREALEKWKAKHTDIKRIEEAEEKAQQFNPYDFLMAFTDNGANT